MTTRTVRMALMLAAATGLLAAAAVSASPWNDRTIIKVSEPVIIPGATLQPGTYVFKLADMQTSRHVVQVLNEDESKVLATTQAIPAKRQDPEGDTVLRFNPTESGPPAIKAWFYPGTIYGHEFIYADNEAKDIAQRTKSVVLSSDVEGSDKSQGSLFVYNDRGERTGRTHDDAMNREWSDWQKQQAAAGTGAAVQTDPGKESTAAMVSGDQAQAMKIRLDALEDDPQKFIGKTIAVDAEVERVLGPRLFTIDEVNWADLESETLVHLPSNLAALVREGDRVTVTGTVKPFVRAEIDRDLGWLQQEPGFEVKLQAKPVLLASRIVGGSDNVAMIIDASGARQHAAGAATGQEQRSEAAGERAVGTAGTTGAVSGMKPVATAGHDMIGRSVKLENVQIAATGKGGGFWVRHNDTHVFVMPADEKLTATAGKSVDIDGVVLQMPRSLREDLRPGGEWNDAIYVYATSVK